MEDLVSKFERLRDERDSLVVLGLDLKDDEQAQRVLELMRLEEHLIGFKPNVQFYQSPEGQKILQYFRDIDGIRIIDAKLADGTNTNKAAIKSYAPNFDAVTLNTPDVEGTVAVGKERGMDSIIMGAMSFPSTLRRLSEPYGVEMLKDEIHRGIDVGAQGIVIGATSFVLDKDIGSTIDSLIEKSNSGNPEYLSIRDLTGEELEFAIRGRNDIFGYCAGLIGNPHSNLIALVPGIGRQGGKLEQFLDSGINVERCMINAGSDILKADTPYQILVEFNQRINELR